LIIVLKLLFKFVQHIYSARSLASAERWIHFWIRCVLAVFMRSAITLPKVNRFGLNLEHSEYIVGPGPRRFWARSAQ